MLSRIIAATIQTGVGDDDTKEARVISLHFYTNRGRNLVGQASECRLLKEKEHSRDGVLFVNVETRCFDMPLKDGNVKGLWGRSDDKEGIIWRLGVLWGDLNPVSCPAFFPLSDQQALTRIADPRRRCSERYQRNRPYHSSIHRLLKASEGSASKI